MKRNPNRALRSFRKPMRTLHDGSIQCGATGARLRARIERDIAAGLLPAATDAVTLAGLVMALIQGMSVLARDGAPRARLIAIGNAAPVAWPGR